MPQVHRTVAAVVALMVGVWIGTANAQPAKSPAPAAKAPAAKPGGIVVVEDDEDKKKKAEPEEEIEEVVVVSASKTAQTIEEAPSIISAVTRNDILTQGYRSIGEVLRNTVGFGINDNGHWQDTGVRGINDRTTYGDKIQFLLDGHNMGWRQFNRNFHNASWIPMEDIERIEMIRGPGAAIWGSNALTGVVNIVARDWTKLKGAEVVYGGDHRFASQFVSARVGKELGDLKLYASASYTQDNDDSLLAPIKEFRDAANQVIHVVGARQSTVNIQMKAKYKWFTLSFHKSRFDAGAPLSTFSIVGGDDSRFVTDRHIVRLAFEKMLTPGLTLLAQVDFDDYRFDDGTVYESNPGAPNVGVGGRALTKMAAIDRRWEGRVQASWVPNLKLSILGGMEFEYLDIVRWHFPDVFAADGVATPTYTNSHFGAYVQAQYAPVSMLKGTVGARFDYDQIYGAVATPRAGVVLNLPAGFYIKGLFGMAFKGPSFNDLYYFRKNAFYGNPELDPETSYTGEGQLGWKPGRYLHVRATGFYTLINKLIGYKSQPAGTALASQDAFPQNQRPDTGYSQKQNLDKVTTKGVEIEAEATPHRRVSLKLQGTYRLPQNADGERLPYSSQWTTGGSVTLRVHRNLMVTLRGLAVGDKEVPKRAFTSPGFPGFATADDPTTSAPAYFVGSFVVRAHGLFNKHLNFHFKLDNFTNSEYWDAGREVLYPQRGFQGMFWATGNL